MNIGQVLKPLILGRQFLDMSYFRTTIFKNNNFFLISN